MLSSPHRSTILICSFILAASCGATPNESAHKRLASGESYFEKKQFAEAIIEFRAALQGDPNLGVARLKLARAFIATNDYSSAFPEYLRAGDLLPDDLDVQAEVGNIQLLARQFDQAKDRARAILQKDPSHPAGLVLLGNALAGLQDLESAVAVAERAVGLDAQRLGPHMNLGALQLARGDYTEAEQSFKRAVALSPGSVGARLSLANFYRATGKLEDSEREFQQAVSLDPTNFQANRAIASFYVETNLRSRAEPHLRRIAEKLNDASSWLELADLLVADGRAAEALRALGNVSTDSAVVKIRIASVTHASGRIVEAHKMLADLLAVDPNNADALALDSRLLLAEGRIDDASARARAALQANPNSIDGHFAQGRIHLARRELEPARRHFVEILSLYPGSLEARLEISKIHLDRREIDTAIQVAREAVRVHPYSVDARLAVVRALLARPEDHGEALREAQDVVTAYPSSAPARATLGDYFLATDNKPAARREFARALEMDRRYLDALAKLVALDVSSGRSVEARKRLVDVIERDPRNTAVLLMTAKVLVAERQFPRAEQMLRRVIELDRSEIEAYALLGQMFLAQKRLPEATREFAAIVERDPRSSAAHTMLGLLFHAQRRVPEAITHYEKALEHDPTSASAANNLAWLLAENKEQLDRALQLAKGAQARLPQNAEIVDTLGWVYLQREMLALAVTTLEEAVRLAPANPLYAYHLGVAYAKNGDDAKARKSLEGALKLRPDFERAEDAKTILAKLVY
jgi:tetratricopeptide (TPR) repeat protein